MPVMLTGFYDPEANYSEPGYYVSEETYYGDDTTTWIATGNYVDNDVWLGTTTTIATNDITGDEITSIGLTGPTGTVTSTTFPTDEGIRIVVVGPDGEVVSDEIIPNEE